jgi:hypothetical protein
MSEEKKYEEIPWEEDDNKAIEAALKAYYDIKKKQKLQKRQKQVKISKK